MDGNLNDQVLHKKILDVDEILFVLCPQMFIHCYNKTLAFKLLQWHF